MKFAVLLIFCLITLASCSMKYASKADSLFGMYGYSEIQIDTASWMVTFDGDETLDRQVVERYVLFRCAELAVEKGFDHFIIIDNLRDAETRIHEGLPVNSTTTEPVHGPGGGTVTVTTTTRSISVHNRYTSTKTIRMIRGASKDAQLQVYNAQFMVNSMASEVNR